MVLLNKHVLFLDSVHPSLEEELKNMGCAVDKDFKIKGEELLKVIHKYDGLVIRSRIKIDQAIIDRSENLQFIARAGSGMENIDVKYAEQKGIHCLHAAEGNRDAVAEHAIGMLLSMMNNLQKAAWEVADGKWLREENRGRELVFKTVGIIGYGNTGSAFAKKLNGFDVMTMAYDKYKKSFGNDYIIETTMDSLFEEAEVVSLHIPLTDETEYLVNDEFLSKFKHPIYLINTSRGKIVDTKALVKHMKTGKVLGACLDVLEYEKSSFEELMTKGDRPEELDYLLKSDRAIITPHIAGWTKESNLKIAHILAEKIGEVLDKREPVV